ncbi:MAG: 16S rRNA (cytosine1402-N4)-methyltransferase [Flavobacteriales bacterium]|jgi:16S rRNA (cytosine1402-N4)-methyltransferase
MTEDVHVTVLLAEAIESLVTAQDGVYIDGTFGRGGHARKLLSVLGESGRVYGVDKDPRAITAAQELERIDARFISVHDSFANMRKALESREGKVDGVLLDLGVSSPQLDVAERGFSFMKDGPLDMRMDTSKGITAKEWLEKTREKDMLRAFRMYGEEKFSKRIAAAIVAARNEGELSTTAQLASLIDEAVPVKEDGKHPATRVFQAIRIAINGELDDLRNFLESLDGFIKPGGRVVIISFHSLEDRMVKRFFKALATRSDLPKNLPLAEHEIERKLKIIGKAVKASKQEVENNVRARSAVMRVVEFS